MDSRSQRRTYTLPNIDCGTTTCDYLVIGAGPTSLAFVDALLQAEDSKKKSDRSVIIIVDEKPCPGGKLNDIHTYTKSGGMPNMYHGCLNFTLGEDMDFATREELLEYYDWVMASLTENRSVQFFGQTRANADGTELVSLESNQRVTVNARKVVDSTLHQALNRPRPFAVSQEGNTFSVVCPTELPKMLHKQYTQWRRHVVIGAGRTSIDTVLHLLEQGVEPDAITWIRPRDFWLVNVECVYPDKNITTTVDTVKLCATAKTSQEVFLGLERLGMWCRIDTTHMPTGFNGVTVTRQELAELQKIQYVIRMGRVRRIEADRIIFEKGAVRSADRTLYVDCTGKGYAKPSCSIPPIFEERRITLQNIAELSVGEVNSCFCAALIGHLEASNLKDDWKNKAVTPMPRFNRAADIIFALSKTFGNMSLWGPETSVWVVSARPGRWCSVDKKRLLGTFRGQEYTQCRQSAVKILEGLLAGGAERRVQLQTLLADNPSPVPLRVRAASAEEDITKQRSVSSVSTSADSLDFDAEISVF